MLSSMPDDWTSAAFRDALLAMVRRRVPPGDADDVVQAALTEAVASDDRPRDREQARRWIWGVARNKVADYHRRARREVVGAVPESAAPPSREAERDLLRWAVGELPPDSDAKRTFEWLLREGDGETLEAIAEEARLPPPQVRQRVSRMRRLFRARWAQLAAAGLVGVVAYLAWRGARSPAPDEHRPSPLVEPPEVIDVATRARQMRDEALRSCDRGEWARCLDGLDRAQALDPAGDENPAVQSARQRARDALTQRPPPPIVTPVGPPLSWPGDAGRPPARRPDAAPPRRIGGASAGQEDLGAVDIAESATGDAGPGLLFTPPDA